MESLWIEEIEKAIGTYGRLRYHRDNRYIPFRMYRLSLIMKKDFSFIEKNLWDETMKNLKYVPLILAALMKVDLESMRLTNLV